MPKTGLDRRVSDGALMLPRIAVGPVNGAVIEDALKAVNAKRMSMDMSLMSMADFVRRGVLEHARAELARLAVSNGPMGASG